MVKKLSETDVKEHLKSYNCKLLTPYKNSRSKINILCSCGHNRTSVFSRIKIWKQYKCKECTINNNYNITTKKKSKLHNSKLKLKSLEKKLKRSQYYRNDFKELKNKKCTRCLRLKPSYLFYNHEFGQNGKYSICKKCDQNINKIKNTKLSISQFIKKLLSTCKSSTKKRIKKGRKYMIFELTEIDILKLKEKQNNKCIYTEFELIWKPNSEYSASIDRIDSDLGYTINNIQLVCNRVNQMKGNLTDKTFRYFCNNISST